MKRKVKQRQFLDISWDCIRLTVVLFYVVSMTTVSVRPPIKPTSAVISSPKSFVIALICILQLSVLAHSKNNQPPLKTGNSIIIISVDLYKISLKSLCLTSALHWLDLSFIFINIHISQTVISNAQACWLKCCDYHFQSEFQYCLTII